MPAQSQAKPDASYPIAMDYHHGRVKVISDGRVMADSQHAVVVREGSLEPVIYFPRDDVRMDLLSPSTLRTHCPFRGNATYFDLELGGNVVEHIAWSYENPYDDAALLQNHIAFHVDKIDNLAFEQATTPAPSDRSVAENPLLPWLVSDAWKCESISELVSSLVADLREHGFPLFRLAVVVRTLHPLLSGAAYRWQENKEGVTEILINREQLSTDAYLNSPLVPIFDGAGGVRRRLEDPETVIDYGILKDLKEEGVTDYAAMPMLFSDGQISAITIATRRQGGFQSLELGYLYEALPLLSRLLEVHLLKQSSATFLETYLGQKSGRRVLNGNIRRGDVENIHAVIWFCDLRDSTALADSMSREAFLGLLNRFFDCMAGAVLQHGGEVLRFIGDAALAIFPIDEPLPRDESFKDMTDPASDACCTALAAAQEAANRIDEENRKRSTEGRMALSFGMALHVGDVSYGNIGTESRLEFTVVGSAANEAARIESMSKTLGERIVISDEFVRTYPGNYRSLGKHVLRGFESPRELFSLPE